jgi:predicted nucleotidyltransferase
MRFIKENIHIEDIKQPEPYHVDEIELMHEETLKNLNKDIKIPKDVMNSFEIQSELNPDIWKGDKLIPSVRQKLMKIGKDFFKSLELPSNIKIKDILFVGSLANYNWSKFSDIDLHIVIDFKELGDDHEQIKKGFDAEKNLWNEKHDIDIHGYPVEIYVQDIKEKLEASAIYSVAFDKWKLMPERKNFKLDKLVIKNRVNKLFNKLKDIKYSYDTHKFNIVVKKSDELKKQIKKMRQSGLQKGGEFSTENLVFKVLRRTKFMEILDNLKIKAYDKIASLK